MSATFVLPRDLGKYERRVAQRIRLDVQRGLQRAGRDGVDLLRARSLHIFDLGGFQKGWRSRASFDRLEFWNAAAHWIYVERGRRPGAPPPPVDAIRPWVIRKFGDDRLAWAIARNIGRRGIAARPVILNPAVRALLSDIVARRAREARDAALRGAR